MSLASPTPENSTFDTSITTTNSGTTSSVLPRASPFSRSHRVLSCTLCQRRKVKCDRQFPCSNCIRSKTQCMPATLAPRRRRRKFAERELLDQIHKYEDLLRQNSIKFKPLHGDSDSVAGESPNTQGDNYGSGDEQPVSTGTGLSSPSTFGKPRELRWSKNFWHASKQQSFQDPSSMSEESSDDVSEIGVKKAWDEVYTDNGNLLFGSSRTAVELSTLHPEPVQIFRIWQIYINNVDPLLKVTHTPSLQDRFVEAASSVTNISPALEALMFSVYSISIMSLTADECQGMFAFSKEELLTRYHFGCQQALINCDYLRTSDRECLTAFYLFLVSITPHTDPRSLSSMLGVAMRIARRMDIHSELACTKCTAFEGEMRRKLWWSLELFDTRIGEVTDYKSIALAPTWDCRIPLNVNDSDLRPEMKEQPPIQGAFSDSLFTVVRSELADFVRHTKFHLEFTDPLLNPAAKAAMQGLNTPEKDSGIDALENMIEGKYLKFCDPEIPMHFMTIWTARAYLAKCRLIDHYSRYSYSSTYQSEEQRDAAFSHAINFLKCDTTILDAHFTKSYLWFAHFHFPFPGYNHILQDLRRRPTCSLAKHAWEVMSDNFVARSNTRSLGGGDTTNSNSNSLTFFSIFSKIILRAWEACEAAAAPSEQQPGESSLRPPPSLPYPRIVSFAKDNLSRQPRSQRQQQQRPHDSSTAKDATRLNTSSSDSTTTAGNLPIGFDASSDYGGEGGDTSYYTAGCDIIPGQDRLDLDIGQLDWWEMAWDFSSGYPIW